MASVPVTVLRKRLALVGHDWQTVRVAASRWCVHKLRARYPEMEWRAFRETLYGGSDGAWTIEVRRRESSER
jgi:hypothetical protein